MCGVFMFFFVVVVMIDFVLVATTVGNKYYNRLVTYIKKIILQRLWFVDLEIQTKRIAIRIRIVKWVCVGVCVSACLKI